MFYPKNEVVLPIDNLINNIKDGVVFEKIFIDKNLKSPSLPILKKWILECDIPCNFVPEYKLNQLTNLPHKGIVALKSQFSYFKLQDIIDYTYQKGEIPLFLMLDGVTDIRNIGAIARTALACKVHGLILPTKGSAGLNKEALRASAGYLAKLTLIREANLGQSVDLLQLNGIQVVTTSASAEITLPNLKAKQPICIVIGDEHFGIQSSIIKKANFNIKIPIFNEVDSFNVSVATGIILYEISQQRNA